MCPGKIRVLQACAHPIVSSPTGTGPVQVQHLGQEAQGTSPTEAVAGASHPRDQHGKVPSPGGEQRTSGEAFTPGGTEGSSDQPGASAQSCPFSTQQWNNVLWLMVTLTRCYPHRSRPCPPQGQLGPQPLHSCLGPSCVPSSAYSWLTAHPPSWLCGPDLSCALST